MIIGPAPVLAVIVGVFHVSAYVFIRGRVGARLPLLLVAAVLGSWAGDAVGGRLGDPIRIGDFHVLAASVVAWLGIALVAILAILVPERPRAAAPRPSFGRRVLGGLGRSELDHGRPGSSDGSADAVAESHDDPPASATEAGREPELAARP